MNLHIPSKEETAFDDVRHSVVGLNLDSFHEYSGFIGNMNCKKSPFCKNIVLKQHENPCKTQENIPDFAGNYFANLRFETFPLFPKKR